MAEQSDDRVSREAFERVTRERDEFKTQVGELGQVAKDFHFVNKAYAVFKGTDVADPYAAAQAAVRDVTLKSLDPLSDGFTAQLTSYVDQARAIFGGRPAAAVEAAPEAAPKPAESTFTRTPNPAAPGEPSGFTPMVVGSDAWKTWSAGRTVDEQLAAIDRGEAVPPRAVAKGQRPL